MKQSYKTLLLWVVLVAMFVFFWQVFNTHGQAPVDTSYSDFLTLVEQGRIDHMAIKGQTYTGTEKDPNHTQFRVTGVTPSDVLLDKLHSHQVDVRIEKEDTNGIWLSILIQGLPLAFLFLLFFFFMRQLQGSGGKAMSFGKSKAKLLSENHNKVTFNDVAGIDEAKGELEEIIDFLKDPKKFTRLGGRIPKGVLLMGPPAPARPCWRAPSPVRPECPSSPSRARTSSRCSWASAPAVCATSSSKARRMLPASCSSTRSTPWAVTAVPGWAAVTTSANRP